MSFLARLLRVGTVRPPVSLGLQLQHATVRCTYPSTINKITLPLVSWRSIHTAAKSVRCSPVLLSRPHLSSFRVTPAQGVVQRGFSSMGETKSGDQERGPWERTMGFWLATVSGMIFVMVVLGGVTRLTKSGLSMSYWKPTAVMPPTTLVILVFSPSTSERKSLLLQEEWEHEFEIYKQFPEYKIKNAGMSLEEFKFIFYMEWFHRVWGRAIGETNDIGSHF